MYRLIDNLIQLTPIDLMSITVNVFSNLLLLVHEHENKTRNTLKQILSGHLNIYSKFFMRQDKQENDETKKLGTLLRV